VQLLGERLAKRQCFCTRAIALLVVEIIDYIKKFRSICPFSARYVDMRVLRPALAVGVDVEVARVANFHTLKDFLSFWNNILDTVTNSAADKNNAIRTNLPALRSQYVGFEFPESVTSKSNRCFSA
jgi:hypothetical protein